MKDIFYLMTFPDKKIPGQHVYLTCTHDCPGVLFPIFLFSFYRIPASRFLLTLSQTGQKISRYSAIADMASPAFFPGGSKLISNV